MLPAEAPTISDEQLVTLIVGAEGDLKLVAERLQITDAQVLSRFVGASVPGQPLQNMLLLQLLQLMVQTKEAILSNLHDFTPTDAIKVLQLAMEGVKAFAPAVAEPPVLPAALTQFNVNIGRAALQDPQLATAVDYVLQAQAGHGNG
jgi:hypothetical protein